MEGRRGEVRWEEYLRGGERRLDAGQEVWSLAAGVGFVCGTGAFGCGAGRRWSWSGHIGTVRALLFVGGRLISGSYDRGIRVWDIASGRCEGVLEGHADWVTSLALCGSRLLSGSHDGTVRGGVEVAVRADSGWAPSGCSVYGGVGGQGGVRVWGQRYPSVVDRDVGAGVDSAGT
jgi:hypothetical protein